MSDVHGDTPATVSSWRRESSQLSPEMLSEVTKWMQRAQASRLRYDVPELANADLLQLGKTVKYFYDEEAGFHLSCSHWTIEERFDERRRLLLLGNSQTLAETFASDNQIRYHLAEEGEIQKPTSPLEAFYALASKLTNVKSIAFHNMELVGAHIPIYLVSACPKLECVFFKSVDCPLEDWKLFAELAAPQLKHISILLEGNDKDLSLEHLKVLFGASKALEQLTIRLVEEASTSTEYTDRLIALNSLKKEGVCVRVEFVDGYTSYGSEAELSDEALLAINDRVDELAIGYDGLYHMELMDFPRLVKVELFGKSKLMMIGKHTPRRFAKLKELSLTMICWRSYDNIFAYKCPKLETLIFKVGFYLPEEGQLMKLMKHFKVIKKIQFAFGFAIDSLKKELFDCLDVLTKLEQICFEGITITEEKEFKKTKELFTYLASKKLKQVELTFRLKATFRVPAKKQAINYIKKLSQANPDCRVVIKFKVDNPKLVEKSNSSADKHIEAWNRYVKAELGQYDKVTVTVVSLWFSTYCFKDESDSSMECDDD